MIHQTTMSSTRAALPTPHAHLLAAALLAAAIILTALAPAYAADITGSVAVDFASKFVWRGVTVEDGFSVQPSASLNYKGFGACLWANYATVNDASTFDEIDFILTYGRTYGKITATAGYQYYNIKDIKDRQEIFITATYASLLNPTMTAVYDVYKGDGGFLAASLSHSFTDVIRNVDLNLLASASYNIKDKEMGFDSAGEPFSNFYNGELSAGLLIRLLKGLEISPRAVYSYALTNDSKTAISGLSMDGRHDVLYAVVGATYRF